MIYFPILFLKGMSKIKKKKNMKVKNNNLNFP